MSLLHLNKHQADPPRLEQDQSSAAIKAGYPASLYSAQAQPLDCLRITGQHDCDVAIIGAGYTGLNAAITLAQQGRKVILLEAKRVGWGASGRNGGQVNIGQNKDPEQLVRMMGRDDARLLWQYGLDAVRLVRQRLSEFGIDAQAKEGISYHDCALSGLDKFQGYADAAYKHFDYDRLEVINKSEMPEYISSDYYQCGLLYKEGMHLNPLAYVLGLGRAAMKLGVQIYENSEVVSFSRDKVTTKEAEILAKQVLVASNGYCGDMAGRYANYVMPINSYIIATAPIDNAVERLMPRDTAIADEHFVVKYFRISHDQRLVFGGRESYGLRFTQDIAQKVKPRLSAVFPQLAEVDIDFAWGGSLGITRTRLPYFARDKEGVYIAAGFSGHGVAMATFGGLIAGQAMLGDSERFDVMARIPQKLFYGGKTLRQPLLLAAMTWFSLRDRLGI